MLSLVSFTGAHAVAIKGGSGKKKVLLTCMMDDQSTEDNVIAIFRVDCIKSAQQQRTLLFYCNSVFALRLFVRITSIGITTSTAKISRMIY